MKKQFLKIMALVMGTFFSFTSCTDLDLEPFNELTSIQVYEDFDNYIQVLAKLYGGLAVSGQSGPDGRGDIGGQDEGASTYLRAYWKLQQLPTDEAIIAWNDEGLPTLNTMTYSADNGFIAAMYYRIFYQITLANEFIRELSDENMASRGISEANQNTARGYRTEARFLRALSYYHALDLYGNVPFVTEADVVGSFFPEQIQRRDLFNYIESELVEIIPQMVPAGQHEYARADQGAARMLLAKLYLNAEVYTGEARYTEALAQLNEVIGAGYSLEPNYNHLFLADNDNSPEIIFPIAFDQVSTMAWGGATFLINAAIGGDMASNINFGVPGGWQGLRIRPEVANLYPGLNGEPDARGWLYTSGHQADIESVSTFQDGYGVVKFRNVLSTTDARPDGPINDHVSVDFPMFRLADAYLMYAEAVLRGGSGGSQAQALTFINELRERAYGDASGNIAANQLNLDFIIDERARELKWEAHRRTDLIRFGRYTGGDYVWQWKGGSFNGASTPASRNLYPLPQADLIANPTLVQNQGY
ncbi:RagB/SusD family nutrient uptake outer membrane protein [Litoribacter ruber]|uniref:RagB/SusD family nutrient uptake outer membrane protein n=1 Tax=Litoribacter ruber TaxID=702568 RepID=A0AAP2CG99_9BACT|nr:MULTISPECIES: RagB/SusD family nutrient uptake outer membrane protein [Litoribacter]MBS9523255.1 RagB/SusD family nutrient uptake outer membrane protein [Litoribacter alkaliphilus]MBT0810582.1 RagB/SusD family nutrient uptake outer membrane protein [Litoribacter ruber]